MILNRPFLHTTVQVASFFPFSDQLPCFAPARVHTMIFLIQPISLRNNGFSNVFWSCEKLLTSSLTDRRGWSIITSHYSWLLAHLGQDKNIAHRAVSIRFIIKYQTSRTTKNLKERFFFLVWAYRRGIRISTSLQFLSKSFLHTRSNRKTTLSWPSFTILRSSETWRKFLQEIHRRKP